MHCIWQLLCDSTHFRFCFFSLQSINGVGCPNHPRSPNSLLTVCIWSFSTTSAWFSLSGVFAQTQKWPWPRMTKSFLTLLGLPWVRTAQAPWEGDEHLSGIVTQLVLWFSRWKDDISHFGSYLSRFQLESWKLVMPENRTQCFSVERAGA